MPLSIRSLIAVGCLTLVVALASSAHGAGAPVDQATPEQVEQAQVEFKAGDDLFDVQRYEDAIERYRASYEIVASPNSRLMVARSFQELGRLDEAYREYERALAESEAVMKRKSAYADTARAARGELTALRSRVALLRIDLGDVPPESAITVAGEPVTLESGQPIIRVPGKVEVVATAPDGRVARAEVQLAAGRERSVELKLGESPEIDAAPETPEEPVPVTQTRAPDEVEPALEAPAKRRGRPGLRAGAFIAGGVGVAGFAAFGVFGTMNNSTFAELEDQCPGGTCPARERDTIDRGRQQQTIANVAALVGAVGIGVGATLFVLSTRPRRPAEVALVAGPGAIGMRGRF